MTERAERSSTRRRWPWLAVPLLAVVVVVLVWFQPQKLLIDDRVDEPLPTVAGDQPSDDVDAAGASTLVDPATPDEVAAGAFVSLDHGTSGTARVLALADGSRVLRLEGLDTDNGPDLYLYVSDNPPDGPEQAFDDDYVNLGRLEGNQGDQNYDLPADVDLDRLSTVVIWCDRFNSAFGAAALDPT